MARDHLTTIMITHNMKDAIAIGNRLIMMNEGKIIYDVSGEEKKKLTTKDLLDKFKVTSGEEFDNDRVLLSTEAGSKSIKQNKRRNHVEWFRLLRFLQGDTRRRLSISGSRCPAHSLTIPRAYRPNFRKTAGFIRNTAIFAPPTVK